jgi:hypothetical protein
VTLAQHAPGDVVSVTTVACLYAHTRCSPWTMNRRMSGGTAYDALLSPNIVREDPLIVLSGPGHFEDDHDSVMVMAHDGRVGHVLARKVASILDTDRRVTS